MTGGAGLRGGRCLPDRETWQPIDDMLARGAERVEQLAVKQPSLGANNPALVSGTLASQVVRSPEHSVVAQGSALVSSIDPAKPLP